MLDSVKTDASAVMLDSVKTEVSVEMLDSASLWGEIPAQKFKKWNKKLFPKACPSKLIIMLMFKAKTSVEDASKSNIEECQECDDTSTKNRVKAVIRDDAFEKKRSVVENNEIMDYDCCLVDEEERINGKVEE